MGFSSWASFLLAASVQIHWINTPDTLSLGQSQEVSLEAVYPVHYQVVPESLLQSFLQQNSPLPSAFLVIQERIEPVQRKSDDEFSQRYTYVLQPQDVGDYTLFLKAQFIDPEGKYYTAFSAPWHFTIRPVEKQLLLLPNPLTAEPPNLEMDYSLKLQQVMNYQNFAHQKIFLEKWKATQIPYLQLLTAIICAVVMVLWNRRTVQTFTQKSIFSITTRFGIFRKLQAIAQKENYSSEEFFNELDKQIRSYIKIPQSLTTEEAIAYVQDRKLLNFTQWMIFKELMDLIQQSKFNSTSSDQNLSALSKKALDLLKQSLS